MYTVSDQAIKIQWDEELSIELNQQIHFFANAINLAKIAGVIEVVPTYHALTIYYSPLLLSEADIKTKIVEIIKKTKFQLDNVQKIVTYIPTLYNGEDLKRVAEINGLTENEVIGLHTKEPYFIYMMGFLPGFPYLGGLSSKLFTPRLDIPRANVLAGSVGIADQQTGIYPLDSPGGWNIIGHTPVPIFLPNHENPFQIKAGQYIQFVSVSINEYEHIKEEVSKGNYELRREVLHHEEND